MGTPPEAVKFVMEAVCIVLKCNIQIGSRATDSGWSAIKA